MVLAGDWRPASEQLLPDSATVAARGASRGADEHAWLCRLPGSCAPKVGVHTLHLLVHSPRSQLTRLPYSTACHCGCVVECGRALNRLLYCMCQAGRSPAAKLHRRHHSGRPGPAWGGGGRGTGKWCRRQQRQQVRHCGRCSGGWRRRRWWRPQARARGADRGADLLRPGLQQKQGGMLVAY